MITLYHGGEAHDVELVSNAAPNERWSKLREIASRMLRARGNGLAVR